MPLSALRSGGLAVIVRSLGALLALGAVMAAVPTPRTPPPGAPRPGLACAPDNGGLTLPAGFCAVVVRRDVGPVRHIAVAPNGDIFANVQGRGLLALRDTTGDGVADVVVRFGATGGTGIALTSTHFYVASDDAVYRYAWRPGQLQPTGRAETIVEGLPANGSHTSKSIAIGPGDALFVNVGSATNSCQVRDRQERSPGRDPCTELETRAGIWRFSASKPGQQFRDGQHYATGLRNTVALTVDSASGVLYGAVHGRDQLTQNWGYSAARGAENPGEELVRIEQGDDYGWPYCYYDVDRKQHVLAPEYGGDGQTVGRCAKIKAPLLVFPGHWAPMAIAVARPGQFGPAYREGVFVAFHGSWNRAPLPQAGYRVAWAPFKDGRPTGRFSTFAIGSDSPTSMRASGLALGPDGSLYIAADANGTIWRIVNARNASNAQTKEAK